jgi:hypothetical protein
MVINHPAAMPSKNDTRSKVIASAGDLLQTAKNLRASPHLAVWVFYRNIPVSLLHELSCILESTGFKFKFPEDWRVFSFGVPLRQRAER